MTTNERRLILDILQTKTYYYDLPDELIAQTPILQRDMSRLMVLNKEKISILYAIFINPIVINIIVDPINIAQVSQRSNILVKLH